MGFLFEETRIENLGRAECFTRMLAVEADRRYGQVRAQCRSPRRAKADDAIPDCGWPLPRRKRF